MSGLLLCLAKLAAASLTAQAAAPAVQPPEAPPLIVKCRKDDDCVKVSAEGGKTILSVTSKSGIGEATVELKGARWPQQLVLRFYLGGLESLTISCGEQHLSVSVLSHSGNTRLFRLPKGSGEGPQLDKASPYWMEIHTLDAEGKPTKGLPPKGGWFEMTVPKPLLKDEVKVLKLRWIDFYRS